MAPGGPQVALGGLGTEGSLMGMHLGEQSSPPPPAIGRGRLVQGQPTQPHTAAQHEGKGGCGLTDTEGLPALQGHLRCVLIVLRSTYQELSLRESSSRRKRDFT